jgi:hypothetical protein
MSRTMDFADPHDGTVLPGPGGSLDVAEVFAEVSLRMPGRLRGRVPACEGCSEADASWACECCGQELCRACWGAGDDALCQGCLGFGWDELPAEDIEIAAGLLR